tara:strand:- start:1207 stop:1353 length:147 start_codon:yes stop_codon:yes gene_type:complete
LFVNKKNKNGNTANPIGKRKNGGKISEVSNPHIVNLNKIFKLYNFFYF